MRTVLKKIALVCALCVGFTGSIFAKDAPVNAKFGYLNVAWGSSLAQVKMKGYELAPMDADIVASEQAQYKSPISIYSLANKKEKYMVNVALYFTDGKLFKAVEVLNESMAKPSKLAARYGKFSETGVKQAADNKNSFSDYVFSKEGYLENGSILMQIAGDTVEVTMFDFAVMAKENRDVLKATGKATIADMLYELSGELLKNTNRASRISMAFVALTSDAQNTFVENYVTDALTQSVFETGNVRIIERANLEKILSEQKFQAGGLVDDNSAKAIGKIAGVDYVCYGDMKDIGSEITVNARIVDVESGEVIAISRTTVEKDKYLRDYAVTQKRAEQEKIAKAQAEEKAAAEKVAAEKKAAAERISKAKWQVTKNRNEFDEYTTYTFTCRTTTGQYLFVGYDKYDKAMYSIVRAGFYWSDKPDSVSSYDGQWDGIYDVKDESGEVFKFDLTKSSNDNKWSLASGWKKGKGDIIQITWVKTLNQRQLVEIFGSNEIISVRNEKKDYVKRFETALFWEVLASQGITKEEIYAAIDNEKF